MTFGKDGIYLSQTVEIEIISFCLLIVLTCNGSQTSVMVDAK